MFDFNINIHDITSWILKKHYVNCLSNFWAFYLMKQMQAFDSLVAALDTRGSREAQLHSMLQMIEPTFKEAIKRRDASIELSTGRYPNNGATDMIRATCHSGSSNSTPFSVASDSVTEYSDSFKVELGRNDFEKTAITRRADAFLKWMWRECYNQELTCAMKYGEKRCSELLHSCNFCYQIYLVEERHCSSCHTTFKSFYNFSEHTTQCEEKQRTDPNWKRQIVDYSVPIGMILLKLQLASIEVKSRVLFVSAQFLFFFLSS
jgi:hypothetical protein